jgi:uncharacterized protein (DUF983 family)
MTDTSSPVECAECGLALQDTPEDGGLSTLFMVVAIGLVCFGLITALATRFGLIWPRTVASSSP